MTNMLPQGWASASIDEIALVTDYVANGSFKSLKDNVQYLPSGYAQLIRLKDYSQKWQCQKVFVSESAYNFLNKSKLKTGDIIISNVGDPGKCFTVPQLPWPSTLGPNAVLFRPDYIGLNREFSFYSIKAPQFQQSINGISTGTAQKKFNKTGFRKLTFNIPPINEQHRIVEKIDALMARTAVAKEALDAIPTLLDQYRQSVLAAAFRGDLTKDWRENNPDTETAETLLERIREERRQRWEENELAKFRAKGKELKNDKWKMKFKELSLSSVHELPQLPSKWSWCRVDDIGEVTLGRQRSPKHHAGDHMRPYLRVANVFEDRIDIDDVMAMNFTPEEYETFSLRKGDILLNEGQSKELVGRSAIYRNEIPGACFTNTLVRFRSYEPVKPELSQYLFRYYMHSGRFQMIANITTNIAHLGAGRFAELEYPCPPQQEQDEIVRLLDEAFSKIAVAEKVIFDNQNQLNKLNQSILAKAFRGELVPQDPTDEPASVLLERIRVQREKQMSKKNKIRKK